MQHPQMCNVDQTAIVYKIRHMLLFVSYFILLEFLVQSYDVENVTPGTDVISYIVLLEKMHHSVKVVGTTKTCNPFTVVQ